MKEENFAAFRDDFKNAARELLSEGALEARLHLDHELALSQLNGELLEWHGRLEPFGSGNAQPVFFARAVMPSIAPQILKEKHLVLRLRQRNYHTRAIFFDGASTPLPAPPWDVAFRIEADEYQGEQRLQVHVQALRTAEPIE